MSRHFGFSIDYEAKLSRDSARLVLEALNAAVGDNWQHRDQWSTPEPEYMVEVNEWADQWDPPAMKKVEHQGLPSYWTARADYVFSFSPISNHECCLRVMGWEDGTFSVSTRVLDWVLSEAQSYRECFRLEQAAGKAAAGGNTTLSDELLSKRDTTEMMAAADAKVWPQNKKCLLNILEKLKAALPVREVRVDDELK
jgi:hypothetical protein